MVAAFIKAEFARFLRNEQGATSIEYGLIAAFIAIAMIPSLSTIAPALNGVFDSISTLLISAL